MAKICKIVLFRTEEGNMLSMSPKDYFKALDRANRRSGCEIVDEKDVKR